MSTEESNCDGHKHEMTSTFVSHNENIHPEPGLRRANSDYPAPSRVLSDRSLLAPEDAFSASSPPRKQQRWTGSAGDAARLWDNESTRSWDHAANSPSGSVIGDHESGHRLSSPSARRRREKARRQGGGQRRKGQWKKLLWVKQSCESRKDGEWFYHG